MEVSLGQQGDGRQALQRGGGASMGDVVHIW